MLEYPRSVVWYLEARAWGWPDSDPRMGSAVAVWLRRRTTPPTLRKFLLTCRHVIRDADSEGNPGYGRLLEEVLCWPPGHAYTPPHELRDRKSGKARGAYLARVLWPGPAPHASDEVPKDERRPALDWAILDIEDPAFQDVDVVRDWADPSEGGRLDILGYPNGATPWEETGVVECVQSSDFEAQRLASAGTLRLSGAASTAPGMSGGGVFDDAGRLVGIHRSQTAVQLEFGAVRATHIRLELEAHGWEVVPGNLPAAADAAAAESARVEAERLEAASSRLLLDTIASEGDDESAARLVAELRHTTALSGRQLFDAARFWVERHLLLAETAPAAFLTAIKESSSVREQVLAIARPGGEAAEPVAVDDRFFARALSRERDWKRYFKVVSELARLDPGEVKTLCQVLIDPGYLAPQHLIAGLLSHFQDDWRLVLDEYAEVVREGDPFRSLQTTQWNIWLMWGPSIPICTCDEWKGVVALQYGYGDENNSIPALQLPPEGEGGSLDRLFDGLADGRRALPACLTARLRWGIPPNLTGARAQRLQRASSPAEVVCHHEDKLLLQVESADERYRSHSYFSAYLWLMFLVAKAEEPPGAGPVLLGRKGPVPKRDASPRAVPRYRLWEDLLPVFVHANLADAAALELQKQVLVRGALHMLRQLWDRRREMFGPDGETGVRFYLVAGSDYSGCGHDVQVPPRIPLVTLLRDLLQREDDPEFTRAVIVPELETGRYDGLCAHLSACHLDDLVAGYFDYVRPKHLRD